MELLSKYFPNLSAEQLEQFGRMWDFYHEWNAMINVISRKDIDNLFIHHILHSLAIGKFIRFKPGTEVLDLGTGGGFPGIPLAVLFPEVKFTMVDGTGKKIKVVNEAINELQLRNAKALHIRAEELKYRFDFVVCRAVASLEKLLFWTQKLYKDTQQNALPNGLIALKGGNIESEIKELNSKEYIELIPISEFFDEPFFEEKYILYVQY